MPLLQLMVCNSVQRFLPVVGDSRLHDLQEFRALWLLVQGCRKTGPSIMYSADLLNKLVLFCVVDGKEMGELFGNRYWNWCPLRWAICVPLSVAPTRVAGRGFGGNLSMRKTCGKTVVGTLRGTVVGKLRGTLRGTLRGNATGHLGLPNGSNSETSLLKSLFSQVHAGCLGT